MDGGKHGSAVPLAVGIFIIGHCAVAAFADRRRGVDLGCWRRHVDLLGHIGWLGIGIPIGILCFTVGAINTAISLITTLPCSLGGVASPCAGDGQ